MDTASIDRKTTNRKPVEVESASRPGLVHFVSPDLMHCSCKATVEVCRHQRIARIRQAKATKRCRECAGYGAFWWGSLKQGDCPSCFGTGRVA